jgi:hypothetical protein
MVRCTVARFVESRNLFDPAVNLLEPPEWRRGPSREGRHGEFPLKLRQLRYAARKYWDEHFQRKPVRLSSSFGHPGGA